MTDPSTAVQRVTEFTDVWLYAPGRDAIERIHADRAYELRGSDVREVLRELAAAETTLTAVRALVVKWTGPTTVTERLLADAIVALTGGPVVAAEDGAA